MINSAMLFNDRTSLAVRHESTSEGRLQVSKQRNNFVLRRDAGASVGSRSTTEVFHEGEATLLEDDGESPCLKKLKLWTRES